MTVRTANRKAVKSETAIKHGWGRDRYRWVSGLTPTERIAVKEGITVYFEINRAPSRLHHTQSGYKIVTYGWGRWDSREPSGRELRLIQAIENFEEASNSLGVAEAK